MGRREPETLIRLGYVARPIGEVVFRFGSRIDKVRVGIGNTEKYATLSPGNAPWFLMVSQQKDSTPHPQLGHNVILSVTSYSGLQNREIAEKFERETGLELGLNVPTSFSDFVSKGMNLSFPVYLVNPREAMALLCGPK